METHVLENPLRAGRPGWLRRLGSEAGKINILTILLLAVVAAGIYLAIMLVPPYMDHYKFEEKLNSVANLAHRQKDDEVLMKEIQRELEVLDMKLPYDAIQVVRDPEHGRWVRITARYVREVEMVPFGSVVSLEFSSDILEQMGN